jgi:hypothetical protein
MVAILLRLTLALFGANIALVSISLLPGLELDTTVRLYVYVKQGEAQRLILEEPSRAIRLFFNVPTCLHQFFSQSTDQNFESLTDFYAWSAPRTLTLPAAEVLTILQCRWQTDDDHIPEGISALGQ